ncbi:MAG: PLP-dependent aminotransferase family protein [Acidobacteria bacterium]|nr:PLP-dependent aminotransferase family protein [Acidobacteriota bacterium]
MELAITLHHQANAPLHRQLYDALRQLILAGRLTPGERVPSSRALALSLGVSRTTVTQSYDQLISEGYLQTAIGSGTKVCHQLPEELLRPAPVKRTLKTATAKTRRQVRPLRLSAYGNSLTDVEPFEPHETETPIHFKSGRPALDEFPLRLWRRLLLRHYRTSNARMLDYADNAQGYRPLRETLAGYISRSRAVNCEAEQIIIVNGSQQALDLITQVLIERGDTVALENPGYLGARRAFLAQGAKLLPIPVDDAGLAVETLAAHSSINPKVVYVTPSHQFPTGAVLSLPRRFELLKWAEHTEALIIEDDYDSEFRYSSRPIPALQGLADSHSVIYVGTFSKILFPALRVGYMVVPEPLTRVFARAKWLADRQTPIVEQRVLRDFIKEGHLERHLRRMRTLYDRRRQTLVRALQYHCGERVEILGENAGMHLMARVQVKMSDEEFVQAARQEGVGLVSARLYYLKNARRDEFVLGYAGLSERKIQEGVRRLAKIVKEH